MKPYVLLIVAGTSLLALRASATPFDEAKGEMFYAVNRPKALHKAMVPPQGNVSTDDYLVGWAQNSGMNVLADVTQMPGGELMPAFPASEEARKRQWKPDSYAVLADFIRVNRMSELRYDNTTFLMWSKPDGAETARLILKSGGNRTPEPLPDAAMVRQALRQSIKDSRAKQGLPEIPDPPAPVERVMRVHTSEGILEGEAAKAYLEKLSALLPLPAPPAISPKRYAESKLSRLGSYPPEVRNPIATMARHRVLSEIVRSGLLFSDDYWKTARFELRKNPSDKNNQPAIHISGRGEEGDPTVDFYPFDFSFEMESSAINGQLLSTFYPVATAGQNQQAAPAAIPTTFADIANSPGLTGAQLEDVAAAQLYLVGTRGALSEI